MNDAATLKAVARVLADERAAFSALLAEMRTQMRTERSSELYEVVLELQTGIGAARAEAAQARAEAAQARAEAAQAREEAQDLRKSLESVAGRIASVEILGTALEEKASSQALAEALSAAKSEGLLNERVREIWNTIKHEIFPPIKEVHKDMEAIKSRLSELADIEVELTSISGAAAGALDASQTAELLARQSGIALRESLHQIQQDWTNPKEWLRGGSGYQANAVVLHGGGTWVSVTATKAEPGQGEDWRLVVDTLVDTYAEENAEDRTKIDLVQHMASGRVQRSTVALPLPRYLDTWEEMRNYELLDSVVWGNSRYLKTVSGQIGEPGKDKGWAMVGMHGPRGRPGETKQGSTGAPGKAPTMDEILSSFIAHAEARGLFHTMRWSGDWVYGADYAPMEVVRMGRGIYLKSAPGEDRAPSDPQSSTWQCLISGD